MLIAQKEAGASDKQTRNRAGKTSLIEIVHFLTGAEAGKDSDFRNDYLASETFGMEFDLGGEKTLRRAFAERINQRFMFPAADSSKGKSILSNSEWVEVLGEQMFGLRSIPDEDRARPKVPFALRLFRSASTERSIHHPEKQATMQQAGDYQVALLFLLGLDWKIASDWQQIRDQEKTLKELKKAAGAGAFGSIIGKAADLRTQLTVAEARLNGLKSQVASFRVLPQYAELEREADRDHTPDQRPSPMTTPSMPQQFETLRRALQAEAPPSLNGTGKYLCRGWGCAARARHQTLRRGAQFP